MIQRETGPCRYCCTGDAIVVLGRRRYLSSPRQKSRSRGRWKNAYCLLVRKWDRLVSSDQLDQRLVQVLIASFAGAESVGLDRDGTSKPVPDLSTRQSMFRSSVPATYTYLRAAVDTVDVAQESEIAFLFPHRVLHKPHPVYGVPFYRPRRCRPAKIA